VSTYCSVGVGMIGVGYCYNVVSFGVGVSVVVVVAGCCVELPFGVGPDLWQNNVWVSCQVLQLHFQVTVDFPNNYRTHHHQRKIVVANTNVSVPVNLMSGYALLLILFLTVNVNVSE